MSLTIAFFKSVLCNDIGKTANSYCLKINTNGTVYFKQDDPTKVVVLGKSIGVNVTDLVSFQHHPHDRLLNHGLSSDFISKNAVLIHKDSFSIPRTYEFHCTLIEEDQRHLISM